MIMGAKGLTSSDVLLSWEKDVGLKQIKRLLLGILEVTEYFVEVKQSPQGGNLLPSCLRGFKDVTFYFLLKFHLDFYFHLECLILDSLKSVEFHLKPTTSLYFLSRENFISGSCQRIKVCTELETSLLPINSFFPKGFLNLCPCSYSKFCSSSIFIYCYEDNLLSRDNKSSITLFFPENYPQLSFACKKVD